MNIDKKFLSWAFGIISTTVVTFVVAEDRWNQSEQVRSTSYLMYSTVVNGLKRDAARLRIKPKKTEQDKIDIEDLEMEIKEIKELQKELRK